LSRATNFLVAPEVEGYRIAEVLVEEGAVVKQGQLLARLSRDALENLLAQNAATRTRADAAIAQAKPRSSRPKPLWSRRSRRSNGRAP
jgi:multidrug efflux pump subunit AcrA (membrane-fusion protein)